MPTKWTVDAVLRAAKSFFKMLWSLFSHNLGLKLLSVLFALFLWSYVISSSPSITREKTLADVDVAVIGQSVLSSRGLAILTDLTNLADTRMRVKVAQSSFSQVSAENVRVELDLSSIRTIGKQSVKLRGTSTYGSVVQIWPEYIDLEVENQDQRFVPVNPVFIGDDDARYRYSVSRTNPSQITVTGPTSLVQLVSSAQVSLDVTGRTEPHSRVEQCVLLDAHGQPISQTLSRSTNSVTVSVDIYNTRQLDLVQDPEELLSGSLPNGYQVESVVVSPSTVVVAADQALLDSLHDLTIEPVDITGMTQTFTAIAQVSALKGIRYLSSEEVTVTVNIVEQPLTRRFSNVPLELANTPDGKQATLSITRTDVRVTGPFSTVHALTRGDLQALVNLSGLTSGEYELPIALSVDNHPELSCTFSPSTVKATVSDRASTG